MKKIIPSIFTILNLLSGFFGISFLLTNNYNLIAEKIKIRIEKYLNRLFEELLMNQSYKIKVGNNPNDTISEKESSCLPKSDTAFNFLAK